MTILTPARSCQTSVAQLHYTYISLADAFIQSNSQKGNTTGDSALKGNKYEALSNTNVSDIVGNSTSFNREELNIESTDE